jgi:hypothetical protein
MTSEFKKIKNNEDTHYVLETATSGATSAGAVATVPGALGKVKKREDTILAQEKKETPKPRNFVAKNAKMGGAGQHKDKKKAEKQGDVKHKNKEMAEAAKWRSDPDAYDVDDEGNKTPRNPNSPKFGYDPLQRRADTANDAKTPRGKTAALKTSLKMAKGNKGVAEETLDEISQKLAGNYYAAATKKHVDKVGMKRNMYDRIEKDMGKQRKAGVDRALDRLTKESTDEEDADSMMPACPICNSANCKEATHGYSKAMEPTFDPFFAEESEGEPVKSPVVDLSAYEGDYDHNMEGEELSDEELDKMAAEINDIDDVIDMYDEDELAIVDDETGEEIPDTDEENQFNEQSIMEVLSRVERMRAKMRIKRTSAKRQRATKIALRTYSGSEKINKRARRLAIKLMKTRLLRGRDPTKVSVGEKERIERTIEKRKVVIGRLAMRLAPRVRKIEKARMTHTKFTQGSTPNVSI